MTVKVWGRGVQKTRVVLGGGLLLIMAAIIALHVILRQFATFWTGGIGESLAHSQVSLDEILHIVEHLQAEKDPGLVHQNSLRAFENWMDLESELQGVKAETQIYPEYFLQESGLTALFSNLETDLTTIGTLFPQEMEAKGVTMKHMESARIHTLIENINAFRERLVQARRSFLSFKQRALHAAGQFDLITLIGGALLMIPLALLLIPPSISWLRGLRHRADPAGSPLQGVPGQNIGAELALIQTQNQLSLTFGLAGLLGWTWYPAKNQWQWEGNPSRMFARGIPGVFETLDTVLSHVHAKDQPGLRSAFLSSRDQHTPLHLEFRAEHPDGTLHTLRIQGQWAGLEPGEGLQMTGILSDVSEFRKMETTLRVNQRLLQTVFDTLPQAAYVKDRHQRFVLVNSALAEKTGLTPEELVGRHIYELTHVSNDEKKAFAETDHQVLENGKPGEWPELQLTRPDGTREVLHIRKWPLFDEEGAVSGLVGVNLDITPLHTTARALKDTEEQLRRLLDSTAEGIFGLNEEGRITFINPAGMRLLGINRTPDILNHSVEQLLKFEFSGNVPVEANWFLEAYAHGRSSHLVDLRLKRTDGKTVRLELWVHPMRKEREILGAVVTFMDITERLKTNEEHRWLATLVEQMDNNVILTDTTGNIVYVNPAFEKTTGYTREEVLGKNPKILKGGKLTQDHYNNMWKTISHGDLWVGHYSNRRKDGTLYEVESTNFPMRDNAGVISHYISIQRDITRMMELENRLRRSQRLESIGTLAGGIAHDFNNLLVPIIGYAELAKHHMEQAGLPTNSLDEVIRTSERARDLISHILMFSRKKEAQRKPILPDLVVRDVVKLLLSIVPKNIYVEQDIQMGPGRIFADSTQIHQVLMNLCVNATQAMADGGTLSVGMHEVDWAGTNQATHPRPPGRYLRYSVEDTGVGIHKDNLEKVFEPYFTTRTGEGTGLGLHTVKQIVNEHDGAITVVSRPGFTRFEVFLPLVAGEEIKTIPEHRSNPGTGSETILMIDDDRSVCLVTALNLEALGYRVKTFTNYELGLAELKNNPGRYKLLLLDQMMPKMMGEQVAPLVHQIQPGLPIVLCSGDIMEQKKFDEKMDGISAYVYKPMRPGDLALLIRSVLDAQGGV